MSGCSARPSGISATRDVAPLNAAILRVASAEEILEVVTSLVAVDARLVRLGARLHDAGEALHPHELDRSGRAHEDDGGALLLRHGIDPRVARMCRTHARWRETPDVTLEDLLVALADSL